MIELCKPATLIVLISIAGAVYHLLSGNGRGILWWIVVGVLGGSVFQALCLGGMDKVAWFFMAIPVLLVCFFLAVALFSSNVRIREKEREMSCRRPDPCDRCGLEPDVCECNLCRGDFCH